MASGSPARVASPAVQEDVSGHDSAARKPSKDRMMRAVQHVPPEPWQHPAVLNSIWPRRQCRAMNVLYPAAQAVHICCPCSLTSWKVDVGRHAPADAGHIVAAIRQPPQHRTVLVLHEQRVRVGRPRQALVGVAAAQRFRWQHISGGSRGGSRGAGRDVGECCLLKAEAV